MPITDAVAFLGNISETVVNILALHAWWAAAAMPIIKTDSHMFTLPCHWAKTIGRTQKAYTNIEVRLALKTGQLLFISFNGTQPPPILPMLEIIYTRATGHMISVLESLYSLRRKSGNQNK